MKALFISKDLLEEIKDSTTIIAKAHSIFNNACNLEYKDKLITILTKDKMIAPMSIVIDNPVSFDFKKIKLNINNKFVFTDEFIICSNFTFKVDLKNVKVYDPNIESLDNYIKEKVLLKNLIKMKDILFECGKLDFFYPLLDDIKNCISNGLVCKLSITDIKKLNNGLSLENNDKSYLFIKDKFIEFLKAVISYDIANIQDYAGNIIGFGYGLTPSIDDFISGLMTSIIYLRDYYNLDIKNIYKFNNKLIEKSINKTTKVSSEMLKNSAKGAISRGIKQLMTTLLSEYDDVRITNDLKRVISLGETSGSDMAFGIYIGFAIFTDIRYRRNWK
ncbi:DUF2877 domain-containing protein [Clostridium sp. AL.422]|uniref:DUF2877 domain-containing protein n=1 Tax=Clostridium TaxID=1485 RepID=UPI00293DD5DE|nr:MULTISPECIES: DUF2877 domain-containing protein [unclassified Clostridium]MDV4151416.1 DUF2877 domain-containing protein [Clostridium sp. AL.422]